MAETIAVLSLKGGTGKTTAVRTLADVFRRIGLDVLCVDLDPQGNLSDYFDVPADATPTVADVLSGDAKPKAATHDGIIPASPILAEVERGLSGKMGRELVLRKALKDARKQHDLILIDCPPALGLLTINGLVASDWALISSEAQYFAMQGVNGALEVVEQAKEFYNDDLEFLGVVMNIADMRTVHSREAFAALREHFGDKVFETVIRQSIAYAESAESGRSILEYRPGPRARLPRAGRRGAHAHRADRLAAQADAAADGRLSWPSVRLSAGPHRMARRGAADHWGVALPAACMLVSAAVAGCASAQPPEGRTLTARVIERAQLRAAPAGRVIAPVGRFTEYGDRRVYRVVGAARRLDRRAGARAAQRARRLDRRRARRAREHALEHRGRPLGAQLTLRRSGRVVRRMLVTVGAPSSPRRSAASRSPTSSGWSAGSVYGCCALALSGSQTRGRLAGVRLAIHGTRAPERLGRAASNGCARATARDLRRLMRTVPRGTPVRVVR